MKRRLKKDRSERIFDVMPMSDDDELPDRTFGLGTSDEIFMYVGIMRAGPEGSSIRYLWDTGFTELDAKAMTELPKLLPGGDGGPLSAKVTFLAREEDGPKSLHFDLPADQAGYAAVLKERADQIDFARYDFMRGTEYAGAFTTENPAHQTPGNHAECSVLLPGRAEWTPALLGWIIDHHSYKELIKPALDLKKSSRQLVELAGIPTAPGRPTAAPSSQAGNEKPTP
ncbi:MAG: hypothetical protein WDO70_02910 [Alphaproteobacteria bacterium]